MNKAKIEPKTVQGLLRHAKIQTTLDLYTQEDSDEIRAAQGEYSTALLEQYDESPYALRSRLGFLMAVGMNAAVQ